MRLDDIAGKHVGVWGLGREGKAAVMAAVANSVATLVVGNDTPLSPDDQQWIKVHAPAATVTEGNAVVAALSSCDVVILSPGISRYRPDVEGLVRHGVTLTQGTDLWLGSHPNVRTVGITGTKGKSTTSSMIAHALRHCGPTVHLAGNIGVPALALPAVGNEDIVVMELSSYQTSALTHSPTVGVLLNLYPEHLDWHGSHERYFEDKLNMVRHRHDMTIIANDKDEQLRRRLSNNALVTWYATPDGFHVDGDAVWDPSGRRLLGATDLPTRGHHNLLNTCAALAAISALGFDPAFAATSLSSFTPLPHRLQEVALVEGIRYIDDSISTIPETTIAALESVAPTPTVLIAGGHDRGQDYTDLARYLGHQPHVTAVITLPTTGPAIAQALDEHAPGVPHVAAQTLEDAVATARARAQGKGIILLSPAASSYDHFHNFEERGDRFAYLARHPH